MAGISAFPREVGYPPVQFADNPDAYFGRFVGDDKYRLADVQAGYDHIDHFAGDKYGYDGVKADIKRKEKQRYNDNKKVGIKSYLADAEPFLFSHNYRDDISAARAAVSSEYQPETGPAKGAAKNGRQDHIQLEWLDIAVSRRLQDAEQDCPGQTVKEKTAADLSGAPPENRDVQRQYAYKNRNFEQVKKD